MRFFLKTTTAGPMGTFTGERAYEVPGQMPKALADQLAEAGYGEWLRGAPKVETATEAPPPENEAERTLPPWTMSLDPATYIERFPDGPNAELARQHIEAGEEADDGAE